MSPSLLRAFRTPVTSLVPLLALITPVAAQATVLISSDAAGVPAFGQNGGGQSGSGDASFDGHWIAFRSDALNLHPAATSGVTQIYVKDLFTWGVELISVSTAGAGANDYCGEQRITADGRFVVFQSIASNLVPLPPGSAAFQVYLRDRWTGATTLESFATPGVAWGEQAEEPVVSLDGRLVAWRSFEAGIRQLYVRDRSAGMTFRMTTAPGGAAGNGDSTGLDLAPDGSLAVFSSAASNLVAGDTNGVSDVFLQDVATGVIARISSGPGGVQGNGPSDRPRISFDGRYVVYLTAATNVVTPDANGAERDVVVYDAFTGLSERADLSVSGQQADAGGYEAHVSWDGRYVLFDSYGSNLHPADTNALPDYFVRDRLAATTELVSLDSSGNQFATPLSELGTLSPNGRFVTIHSSEALEPAHPMGTVQLYVRERGLICITPYAYCTGKVNSLSCDPWIATYGCSSASADEGFYVLGIDIRNNKQGLLFYGVSGQAANPFQGGTMCVNAPRKRTPVTDSLGNPPPTDDCSGLWVLDMNAFAAGLGGGNPIPELSLPGTLVDCQWWGRDPGASFNTSLTNAVEYLVGL